MAAAVVDRLLTFQTRDNHYMRVPQPLISSGNYEAQCKRFYDNGVSVKIPSPGGAPPTLNPAT